MEYPCLPVGRAKSTIPSEDFIRELPIQKIPCKKKAILSVMPDGHVYTCCSVMGMTDMLKIGQIPQDSIQTIIRNFWKSPVRRILYEYGVIWFIERIRKNKIPINLEGYINDCHICSDVLTAPENQLLLEPLIKEYEHLETQDFFNN